MIRLTNIFKFCKIFSSIRLYNGIYIEGKCDE